MEFYVAIGLFVLTLVFFLVAWYEDIDKDFFKVGPPVRLGTINIDTTLKFWLLVVFLILYQTMKAYLHESFERGIEHKYHQLEKCRNQVTSKDVVLFACSNFFKWFSMFLSILVAVTRFDIWLLVTIVDVGIRTAFWRSYITNGRHPRC
tara:strand:+ start:123 stop:569 length:447 start_codon:yes stop_codon:yes gene_type:complete